MTFRLMPVVAIDSMMTQGIVSRAPTPVTPRIEYHGVCVGQAVTATIEMMKPKPKTMPYCVCQRMPASDLVCLQNKPGDCASVLTHHSGTSLYLRIIRVWPSSKPV
jgi:hypothetical protein